MWDPLFSWLTLGLGCALALAGGGRRCAAHPGEVVTWSVIRTPTKWRAKWYEATTEAVVLLLIVCGAIPLKEHGYGWWSLPIGFVGLWLLPVIPALIHNAQITGRLVLPREAPVSDEKPAP